MRQTRKVFRIVVYLFVAGHEQRIEFDALLMRAHDGFVKFIQPDLKARGFNSAFVTGYTMEATGETVTVGDDEDYEGA